MVNTKILLLGCFQCFCFGMLWQQNHKLHLFMKKRVEELWKNQIGLKD